MDGDGAGAVHTNSATANLDKPPWIDLALAWVVFIAVSYLPGLAPESAINPATLTLFWSFFTMTSIILCDQVTYRLENRSLMLEMTGDRQSWARFLLVGALSGLLLDGVAQWLGKLWIYPYWNVAVYGATFVIGFAAYWIALAESYLAVKSILRLLRPAAAAPAVRDRERLFRAFGIAGAGLAAAGLLLLGMQYRGVGYHFETREFYALQTPFPYFLMTFVGLWLILEYVQFRRGRKSLLLLLLERDPVPLVSLLVASAIFSLLWETVNGQHHFWIYTNWPLGSVQLWRVPVVVLIAWPLQYVVFLSLGFLLPHDLWP